MLMCLVSTLSSILKQKDKEHNSEFFKTIPTMLYLVLLLSIASVHIIETVHSLLFR